MRFDLKWSRVAAVLSEDGRAFHNLGEVIKKAFEPYDLALGVVVVRKFGRSGEI